MYIRMYIHIYIHTYIHTYVYTYIRMACISKLSCVRVCAFVCMSARIEGQERLRRFVIMMSCHVIVTSWHVSCHALALRNATAFGRESERARESKSKRRKV